MAIKKKKFKEKRWFYDLGFVTGIWPLIAWFRPKKIFIHKRYKIKGGAVLCYNHRSYFDFMSTLMAVIFRRHRVISIEEMIEKKFNRWVMTHLLIIPINKDNFTIESYKQITTVLKGGGLIDIFPEGSLNDSDEMLEFKDGPALFALRCKVPIIPIYIRKRKNVFERMRFYFGDPIDLNELGFTKDNLHEATLLLQDKMNELKEFSKEAK